MKSHPVGTRKVKQAHWGAVLCVPSREIGKTDGVHPKWTNKLKKKLPSETHVHDIDNYETHNLATQCE